MPKIPKSDLLNYLLEEAEKIKTESNINSVTIECLLLALIEYVGDTDKQVAHSAVWVDYSKELENTKNALMSKIGFSTDLMKDALKAHLSSGKPLSTMDVIALKSLILRGEGAVYKEGGKILTADIVVGMIFERPSQTLLGIMSSAKVSVPVVSKKENDPSEGVFTKKSTQVSEPAAAEPETPAKSKVSELISRVKAAQDKLLETVYGQDNAVSVFTRGYFQAELLSMTDKTRKRPRATFLFAGPPGVGKTFLAETAAEVLGLPFARFDMSEYSDKEANIEFCGSDKVYKNGKAGNVTSFVSENPKCVLLFDEIEKAHINVIHLFLQMLDAGRLRDNFTDIEVPFTDAIIIFTTNAGKKLYADSESGNFSAMSRKVILKALEKDTNPETGVAYFPPAICSRFASGNVVMFNHIDARDLTGIAKREILRHAKNLENEIGITTSFDENVFSAVLFAEGGAADARTVRSRAESFYDSELFELLRFIESSKTEAQVSGIEQIEFHVDLPENDPELLKLFEGEENPYVLVFSSQAVCDLCSSAASGCTFLRAGEIDEAKRIINENDVKLILCDMCYEQGEGGKGFLNIEDINSKGRDFFRYAGEYFASVPLYLLRDRDDFFTPEESISFLRNGARGFVTLPSEGAEEFSETVNEICEALHQQHSMLTLAKSNRVVNFETAQTVSTDGKKAQVTLFDFRMELAVDSEDAGNILSGVSKPEVRFKDVIGAEDAKSELQYFADYLKNPKKYAGTGVSAPRGVLLYGPPGTGKTMLAKAVAGESDVTFIAAEGNQFMKRYVGEGEEAVHKLFATARKYAPSVLFIDEIDAIAKERKGGDNSDSRESILTAFLTEMDGFKSNTDKPVFVLAATNFDVEPGGAKSLDPALMRRFDRRVYIDLPSRDDRIKYLQLKVENIKALTLSEAEIENIAMRSTGMSLASLESVIELSLRTAIRSGSDTVTDEIFEEAFETFNSGDVKHWDISQLERVARHEAGHAFICWHGGETPSYITVVARGNHGGYMQHADNEGKAIYTKDELLAKIRTSLGGRASEIVYYGEKDGISTGASGDLVSATNMANRIICSYGMDNDFGLAVIDAQSLSTGEISVQVRAQTNMILKEQMDAAVNIISENRAAIDALVEELLKKNHLQGEEIDAIFRSKTNIQ